MTEGRENGGDDLPIEVRDRRLMCENTKFFVYFDHVIDKSGNEVRDYLVFAPKRTGRNLVTGVAVLPIADGRVGLIRIFRPAVSAYSWDIPHGFVDEGESANASALRELLEETRLTVESGCFSSQGYITPDSGVLAARVHLFLAEPYHTSQQIQPELRLGEFRFFPFQELEVMIERSEIQDTFTLAALCKYYLLKNARRCAGNQAGI